MFVGWPFASHDDFLLQPFSPANTEHLVEKL